MLKRSAPSFYCSTILKVDMTWPLSVFSSRLSISHQATTIVVWDIKLFKPEYLYNFCYLFEEFFLGLICGTSSCHMVVSQTPKLVPGVWGPYFSAMIPNMYLNEAGQSATGKLIDFIIETHPAYSKIKSRMKDEE